MLALALIQAKEERRNNYGTRAAPSVTYPEHTPLPPPSAAMSLSVLDVSGTSESDTTTLPKHIAMHKTRLDRKGVPVPGMLE